MTTETSTGKIGGPEQTERAVGTAVRLRTVVLGTAAGVGAVCFGYLLTYALLASSALTVFDRHGPQYSIARQVFPELSGTIPVWKAVGWLYYNAHGMALKFQEIGQLGGGNFLNFLAYEGGGHAWLWLLPALILVIAGALIAIVAGACTPREGAITGATVAIGYAYVLLVGMVLIVVETGGVRISPEFTFVAMMGVPILFGALGGVLGSVVNERRI